MEHDAADAACYARRVFVARFIIKAGRAWHGMARRGRVGACRLVSLTCTPTYGRSGSAGRPPERPAHRARSGAFSSGGNVRGGRFGSPAAGGDRRWRGGRGKKRDDADRAVRGTCAGVRRPHHAPAFLLRGRGAPPRWAAGRQQGGVQARRLPGRPAVPRHRGQGSPTSRGVDRRHLPPMPYPRACGSCADAVPARPPGLPCLLAE